MLPFPFGVPPRDWYEPLATHLPAFVSVFTGSFGGETSPPLPPLLLIPAAVMSKQTRFPLSPPPHLSFFLFAFSPADATSQTFRIPRRTEELRFNAGQLSHTDVHAHLQLCDQTFTARPACERGNARECAAACGKCTQSCAYTCSFGKYQSPLMFFCCCWRFSSSGPAAVISSVVLERR